MVTVLCLRCDLSRTWCKVADARNCNSEEERISEVIGQEQSKKKITKEVSYYKPTVWSHAYGFLVASWKVW